MKHDEPNITTRVLPPNLVPNTHIEIPFPTYDRSAIKEGIVHIGVGGFHRAHQALYAEELIRNHHSHQWGICGVGIMPNDETLYHNLTAQSCFYTLVERSNDAVTANIIGALKQYLFGYNNPQGVFKKLADSESKLVTLTATEAGYYFHQGTGELDRLHPAIQHDLQHPLNPKTIFGYLSEGLDRRRKAGMHPFTILSCDNLQENGDKTKKLLLSFCHEKDPSLAKWVEQNVAFPNCMVDRITSITTEDDRELVRTMFGINDAAPVMAEPFRQWVIEDTFCHDRPPFDTVGAQLTSDVAPYEKMKLRLLNAGHSAMGYLGYLCGYRYIHEIAGDSEFAEYLTQLFDVEISPLLGNLAGIDLNKYKQTLLKRFANEAVNDQALRICMNGSAKLPVFIFPSIAEQINRGGPIKKLTLCVASWLRFLAGQDEQGHEILIQDSQAERLTAHIKQNRIDVHAILQMTDIFGDLGQSERFVDELNGLLEALHTQGSRATLRTCL